MAASKTLYNEKESFTTCRLFNKYRLREKPDVRFYNLGIFFAALVLLFTFVAPLIVSEAISHYENSVSVSITGQSLHDGQLLLSLNGADIDYENSFAFTPDYGMEFAIGYSEYNNSIAFKYRGDQTNVYIKTTAGNVYHFLVSEIK